MADLIAVPGIHGDVNSHVIFFHGLGGHPCDTWRSLTKPKVFWPQWLSEDVQDLAVWTVGYASPVSLWRGSAMHLTDQATNVLERILGESKLQTGEITLIGHSLGGLIIKQLLRTAESMASHRDDAANFVKRVRRVAFLATPHSGADLPAWGDRLRIIIRPSAAVTSLVRNDPNLRDLNFWYREWSSKHSIEHLILIESKPLRLGGLIVKPDSSDLGLLRRPISIDADHITICKPEDRSSEIYVHIQNFVVRRLDPVRNETVIEHALKEQSLQLKTHIDATQKEHSQLSNMIADQGERTADLLKDVSQIAARRYPKELVDNEIQKQLSILRRARFFNGFSIFEQATRLAEKMRSGEFEGGSDAIKSNALAWCARFLALGEDGAQSDELLNLSKQLGNGPEITVAEAFRVSDHGDMEGALSKLANIASPLARSAAFMIVAYHRDSAAAAIEWLSAAGFSLSDLDPDGKFVLIGRLLQLGRWDAAFEYANALHEEDFQQSPVLFQPVAMANLVRTIPDELKSFVLQQVPFNANTFPLAANEASLRIRREACDLFSKCALAARELGCVEVANTADDYALWLELRDPEGSDSGREKLKVSMREPEHALRRLHFARQFGLKLDLEEVEQEIKRQTALSGGKSQAAAIARFSLAFTQESPKAIAAYIDRHRAQLQAHLEKKSIGFLEIEVLARAGFPQRAEECLKDLADDGLSEAEESHLHRIIAEATGVDPMEARKTQFESSGQLNDLVSLVHLLEEQNDWSQLCHYGPLLFERTLALADAERLARALNEEKRYNDLAAFLKKYPEFRNQSDNLQMLWSWSLYREGSLAASAAALDTLKRKRDHLVDRALTVNLAITSGAWETLLPHVEQEWVKRDQREADELLQTAQFAHVVNSPRAKDLVYAAADKGVDNAHILAEAYFLASNAGWEDSPSVTQWLHKAAELSDSSGPIQRMSTKELLDRKPEWDRRETETWQQVYAGNLPIFGAAHFLHRSLIDLFLLPALANPSELDPRRRALVPAYSGVRQPLPCNYRVVAMEATALLTLGALGLLETALGAFEQVVIPHSTLGWLFTEKQRSTFHQPSRIRDASRLSRLLATGALKEFSGSTVIDADLAAEVGEELASFIAEAKAGDSDDERQRLVIRSSPVYRASSLMEEKADLSPYYSHLCSCLAVVNKLKQKSQLTVTEERRARSYLSLHEKDWPRQPEISDGAILYLDGLSVSYLQDIGLLEKLQPAGLAAYISARKKEEANALIRYEQLSSEVNKIIGDIRNFLAAGIQTEKIKVGQMLPFDEAEESQIRTHPTFAIVDLAKDAEAIIVDDRFLNQHRNVDTGFDHTPILTTLDLLDALYSKSVITLDQMLDYRTNLRRDGYLFVPVTNDELERHLSAAEADNGHLVETAELKAIRENILRIRMSSFLQLPKEAPWLSGLMQALILSLKAQWRPGVDGATARARSEWLLHLLDMRGWAPCLDAEASLHMAKHRYAPQILLLLSAPSNIPSEAKEKYLEWVDEQIVTKIREEDPELYSWLMEKTKELIAHATETDLSEESE